jgi:hypothetical protein
MRYRAVDHTRGLSVRRRIATLLQLRNRWVRQRDELRDLPDLERALSDAIDDLDLFILRIRDDDRDRLAS